MTGRNKVRLAQLKAAILKDQYYGIDFREAFNVDFDKTLGVDEFPHDREFIKKFFRLTNKQFDCIFIPKDFSIRTQEQYIQHLDKFL